MGDTQVMLSQYQKFVFGGAKLFALVAAVGFLSTIAGATQNPEQQAPSLNAQPIKMAWAATSPRLADSEFCAPHCAADFPDYWHLYLAANNGEEAAVEAPSLLRVPARQLQEGHIVLATLRAVNIQVRGQWHAEPSNAFSIYAQDNGQKGILMLTTSLSETKVVTVEVKDMFSYLNPLYEDLAATAFITVQPGMPLARLLSFTPSTVYIGEKNVKGVVTLVNYKNAVQGCNPQQIYSPYLFSDEPNIFGFPDWLSNYNSKENFAIDSAEYSFDIAPPATSNIHVFSVTAKVYCYLPNNNLLAFSFTDNYTLAVEELPLQFTNAPTDFVAAPAGKVAEVYDVDGRGSYDFTFTLIGGGQYVNADNDALFSLGEKDGRLTVHNGVEQKELYRAPYLLTVEISDDRPVQNGGPQAITAALSVVLMTVITNGKNAGVNGVRGEFVYTAGGQARTLQADEDFELLPKINSGATLIVRGGSKIAVQSDSFVFVLEPGYEDRLILINGSSLLGLVTSISDSVEGLTAYYGKENLLEGEQGVIYQIGAGTQFEKLGNKPLLQCIDFGRLGIKELRYACGVSGEQAQIVGDSAGRRLRTLADAAVVPLAAEPSNSLRLDFVSKSLTNKEDDLHFLVTRGSLELPQLLTNYLNMPAYGTGRWLLYDIEDNSDILTVAPGPQMPPFAKLTIHAHQDVVMTVTAANVQTQIGWEVLANTDFVVGEFDGVVRGVTQSSLPPGLITLTVQVADQFSVLRPQRYTNYLATGQVTIFVWEPLEQSAPPTLTVPHLFGGVLATLTAAGGDGQYTYDTAAADFSLLPAEAGAEVVLSVLTPQEGFAQHIITVVLRDSAGSRAAASTVTVIFRAPVSLSAMGVITVHSEYVGVVTTLKASLEGGDYIYSPIGISPQLSVGIDDGVVAITAGVAEETLLLLTAQVQANTNPPSYGTVTVMVKVLPPLELAAPSPVTVVHLYTGIVATLSAAGGNGVAASYSYAIDSTLFDVSNNEGERILLLTAAQNGAMRLTGSVVLSDMINSPPATAVVTVEVLPPLSVLALPQRLTLSHQQAGSVAAFTASGGDGNYSYTLPQSDKFSLLPGATSAVLSLRVPPQEGPAILAVTVTLRDAIGSLPVQAAATVEILSPLSLSLAVADGHVHSEYIGTVARVQGQGGYSDYGYSLVGSAAVFAIDEANGMISIIQAVEGLATLSVTVRVSDKPPLPALPTEAIATMVITVVEAISFGEVPAKLTVIANYWQFLATLEASGGYGDISLSISGDDLFYLTNGTLSYGTLYATPSGDDEQARMITLVIVADDTGAAVPEAVSIAVAVSAKLAASFATRVRTSRQVIDGSLGYTQTSGGIAPYTYRLVDGGFSIIGGDGGGDGGGGLPVVGSSHLTVVMTTGQLSVIAKFDGATELTVKWAVNDSDNERTPELTVTTVVEVVDGVVFRSSRGYQMEVTAQVSGHPERTGALELFTLFAVGADGEVSYAAPIFIPSTVAAAFTVLYDGAGVVVSLTSYLLDQPQKLSINILISAEVESQDVTDEQLLQILVVQPPPVSLSLPLMMTLYDGGDNCCLVAATITGESGLTPYGYTLFDDSGNLTIVAEENSTVLSLRVKPTAAATLTVSLAVFDAYQPPRSATVKAMVTVLAPLGLLAPATLTISYLQTGVLAILEPSGGRQPYTHQISEQAFTVHTTEAYVPSIDSAGATLTSMVQVYALSITEAQAGLRRPTLTIVLTDAIGSPPLTATMFIEVRSSISASVSVLAVVPSNYTLHVGRVFASGADDYIYSVVSPLSLLAIDADGVISLTAEIIGATILYAAVQVRDSLSPAAITLMLTVNMSPPLALTAPDKLSLAYRSLPVLATLTMTGGHGEYSLTWSDLNLFTLSIDVAATVAVLSLAVAQESPWHTTLTIVLRDTLGSPPVVAAVTMMALPQLVLPEAFLTIQNSVYSIAPQDNRTSVSLQAAGGSGNYVYSLESAQLSVDAATGELFVSEDIGGPVTLTIEALVRDPISLPQTQATANILLVVNSPLEVAGSAYPLFSGVVDTAGKIKPSGAWGRERDTFSLVRNPNNAFAVQPDGLLVITLAQPITVLTPVVLVSNGAETMEVSVEISVQAEIGGGDLYEDGEMLIIGGYRYGAAKQKILSAEVWASDDGIAWELRTAAAEFGPRILPEAIQYKGRIWLIGGESADGLAQDIWSSSDGGVTWRRDVEKVPFGDTFGGALVAYNGKMWFLSTGGEVWNTDNGIDWNSVAQGKGYPQRPQGKYFAEAFGIRILLFAGDGENADIWASSDGTDWTRTRNEQNWLPRDGVAIEASRRTEDGLAFNEQIFVVRGGSLNQHDEILVAKGGGDEWDLASHMPSTVGIDAGRQYAGFVFYRGNLYVAGGRRINGELLGDVWRGNRNGLNWKLATGNLGGRSHHAMIVAKRLKLPEFSGLQLGDMYVVGGIYTPGQVWRYRHGEWTKMPVNLNGEYVEMVYYDDALYAHAKDGGAVGNLYFTRYPEKGWNRVANELSNTQLHMVSYDGKLITIQDDKVWFFEDGKWTHKTYEGRAGGDIDLVAHKGLLYALGGYADSQNGPYFDDVWRSADGENWTKINDPAGFPPQAGNFVSDNEYIYLMGGHAPSPTDGGSGEGGSGGSGDKREITQLVLKSTDAIHWVTLYAPSQVPSKYGKRAPWATGGDQYESDLAVGSDGEIYVVGGSGVKDGFWESEDQAESWMDIAAAWDNDENQGPGAAVVTNLDATIPAVFVLDDTPIIEIPSGFHGDFPLVTMEAVGGNRFFKWSITDDPYNMFDIGEESGIIYAILGLEGPVPFDGGTFEITVRADSDIYSDMERVRMRILPPVSLQARFDTTKGEFTQQEEGIVGNIHWVAGAWGGDEKYNFYSLVSNPQSAFAMDGNALVLTVTGMIGRGYTPVVRLSNGGQFVDIPVAVTVLQPAGSINQGDMFIVGGYEDGAYGNAVWRYRDGGWNVTVANISDTIEKGVEVAYYQGRLYLLGLGSGKNHVLSSADGISWREEAAMPDSRIYHTAVPHEGKLVVFGGYVEDANFNPKDPAVWEFDGEKWSVIHAESFPEAFGRYDFDGVSHRGLLYASGGQSIASFISSSTPVYYNDVWVSADGGRSWKRVDEDAESKYEGGKGVMLKGIDPDSGAINLYQVRSRGGLRATVWSSLAGVEWTQRGVVETEVINHGVLPVDVDFSDEKSDGAFDGRQLFVISDTVCTLSTPKHCVHTVLYGSANGQDWKSVASDDTGLPQISEYQLVAAPYLDAPTPLTFDVPNKWVVVPQNYVGKILTIRAWGGAGVYSYSLLSQQIFSLDQISGKISLLQARTSDLIYVTVRVESGGQVIEQIVQIGSHYLSLTVQATAILVPSNHGGKPFYTAEAEGGYLPYTYRANPVSGQQSQVHITPQGELFIPLVKSSQVQSQEVIVEVIDAVGDSAEAVIEISVTPPFNWAGVTAINEVIPYNEKRKLWDGAGKNFPSGGLPLAGAQPYLFSIGVFTSTPGDHNLSVDVATGDVWKLADGWSGNLYRQQVQITLIWSDAQGDRLFFTRNIEVGGRLRLEWDSDRQSIPNRYAGVIGTLSLQPTDYPAEAVNYYTNHYNFDVSADGAMIANPAPFGPATVIIQVWAENDVLSSAPRMLTIKIDAPIKVGASERAAADHEFLPMASAAENLMMPPRNEEPQPPNILWLSLGSRCFDDAAVKMTAWQNWAGCGAV